MFFRGGENGPSLQEVRYLLKIPILPKVVQPLYFVEDWLYIFFKKSFLSMMSLYPLTTSPVILILITLGKAKFRTPKVAMALGVLASKSEVPRHFFFFIDHFQNLAGSDGPSAALCLLYSLNSTKNAKIRSMGIQQGLWKPLGVHLERFGNLGSK